MTEATLFWGETHDNTHQFAEAGGDMSEVLANASSHLDFYAAAYYTACSDAFRPGGHAHEMKGRQSLILEGWKSSKRLEREWNEVVEAVEAACRTGEFVTFPGYEWQGDGSSGDHNVFSPRMDLPVFRVDTLSELYAALREWGGEAMVVPHHTAYRVGLRGKDWSAHDPEYTRFAEIYSIHGCSETDEEWIGLRANSHLGADEAWALGTCDKCAEAIGDSPLEYRIRHTERFCEQLRRKGKRPLIWDDMFWHAPTEVNKLSDDVILANWNYGATTASPKMMERVDGYLKSGKDVLGCPCMSWGVAYPRRETLDNTKAHSDVFHSSGTLGVINTAWTCFFTLLPTFNSRLAATAQTLMDSTLTLDCEWEKKFWENEFGTDCDGVPEALRDLGELWEIGVAGLERPLTPMLFGCMDMILHYPDGQKERMRRGQFPIDLDNVDFDKIHEKKTVLLINEGDTIALKDKLDAFLVAYPRAYLRCAKLADTATKKRDEAILLAALSELKTVSAKIFDFILRGNGEPNILRNDLEKCGNNLSVALSQFYKESSVERWKKIMWHPQMAALEKLLT